MLLLLASLLVLSATQAVAPNYQIVYSYAETDTSCSKPTGIVVTQFPNDTLCVESPCQCLATFGCGKVQCNRTTVPADPPNAVISAGYYGLNCQGTVSYYTSQTSGTCIRTSIQSNTSTKFICDGDFYQQTWTSSAGCQGTPDQTSAKIPFSGSKCFNVPGGTTSYYYQCLGACIHKDTVIKYHDQEITLQSLSSSADPVCKVPHVLKMNGVKILTSCPGELRLTHKHLVMTPEGWKEAGSLQRGDKLFSKVSASTADCEITNIEYETDQEYFGLNCEDSSIEANGYWISTFGNYHTIPAIWMKVASKIIGVAAASSIGDTLANWFSGLI